MTIAAAQLGMIVSADAQSGRRVGAVAHGEAGDAHVLCFAKTDRRWRPQRRVR